MKWPRGKHTVGAWTKMALLLSDMAAEVCLFSDLGGLLEIMGCALTLASAAWQGR